QLDSDRVRQRMEKEVGKRVRVDAEAINPDGGEPVLDLAAEHVALLVPQDIQLLKQRDAGEARQWREWTRRAFEAYFSRGYEAVDVERRDGQVRYVLERGT